MQWPPHFGAAAEVAALITGVVALLSAISTVPIILRNRRSIEAMRHRLLENTENHDSGNSIISRTECQSQVLAHSRTSFWFSMMFASFGFAILASAIVFVMRQDTGEEYYRAIFPLVSGAIIEAVSSLFFVQSNLAHHAMTDFFEKLRIDAKIDDARKLLNEIKDPRIAGNVKALLAIKLADVQLEKGICSTPINFASMNGRPVF